MRARVGIALGIASALCARGLHAQTDPAAARAQLEIGFDLRQKNQCGEAIAHLQESYRLDPQLKALINLADCEERVSHWVDAERDWIAAREQAGRQSDTQVYGEAGRRIETLEKRMPKLTIRLAQGAPADAVVTRDDVLLGAVSLGTALPTDPGHHVVVAKAAGHEPGRAEVDLVEGQSAEVTVAVGASTTPAQPPPPVTPLAPVTNEPIVQPLPAPPPPMTTSPTRATGIAFLIGGGVFVGVAVATGFAALAEKGALGGHCDSSSKTCDATGLEAVSTGASLAVATDVLGGLGLAGLALGAVLYFVGGPPKSTSVALDTRCALPLGVCLRGSF
ncbi:MAG TPA: hypothetical protein VH054_27300 [Polyangiaceae bacterium]|jgi:hypothetical protein|nr:hypothetical protein [Polyangiaceae bacterium]